MHHVVFIVLGIALLWWGGRVTKTAFQKFLTTKEERRQLGFGLFEFLLSFFIVTGNSSNSNLLGGVCVLLIGGFCLFYGVFGP